MRVIQEKKILLYLKIQYKLKVHCMKEIKIIISIMNQAQAQARERIFIRDTLKIRKM